MLQKSLKELAEYLGGVVKGDENLVVDGLAPLDNADARKITFLANPKYAPKVAETKAGCVLMAPGADSFGKNVIEVANPYLGFAKLLKLFYVAPHPVIGISPNAIIAKSAKTGSDVSIYPNVFIGENVSIGDRCVIYPGAVIYAGAKIGSDTTIHANAVIRERCIVGERCIIQPSAVIGSDGFGYAPDGKGYFPIPQIGIVELEDDVEIGANACIDRAALEVTRIRKGTKIDNLVQIAHNCQIGENCMIVSQVGVSGSTKIGNRVTLGGQVGVAGHITVGDNTMVAAQSGVPGNIPANGIFSGSPAIAHKDWLKSMAVVSRLPELKKRVHELEKKIAEIENCKEHN